MAKVGVIGSGSWGTAICKILCENMDTVHWWVKDEYLKGHISHHLHNPRYLSSIEFHENQLEISTDMQAVVDEVDYLVFTIPSIYLKQALDNIDLNLSGKRVFSAIKGIVPETLEVVGDYFQNHHGVSESNLGVITGPCHAEEVALERQAYLTVAAFNKDIAQEMGDMLSCDFIHTRISDDVMGTEYASVLKNIYSIACGIAHGMNFGDNFQAVLMSNAIRELESFMDTIAPSEKRNINDSAYLGDLLVTGYSFFSRNRMLGNMIGKGYTVQSAMLEMNMVAEGYYAVKALMEIKEKIGDIELPISQAVFKVLHKEKDPAKVFAKLLDKLN